MTTEIEITQPHLKRKDVDGEWFGFGQTGEVPDKVAEGWEAADRAKIVDDSASGGAGSSGEVKTSEGGGQTSDADPLTSSEDTDEGAGDG